MNTSNEQSDINNTQESQNTSGFTTTETSAPIDISMVRELPGNHGDNNMPDHDWTLQHMLERRWLLTTITWPLTAASGADLATFSHPADLLVNDFVTTPFSRFHFFQCDSFTIHVQVVSNKTFSGKLLLTYLPWQSDTSIPVFTLENGILMDHRVFINVADDQITDFKIPFIYYKDFFDIVENFTLGNIYLKVVNQLKTGATGPSSVLIKLWASVQNPRFKVPRLANSTYRFVQKQSGKTKQTSTTTTQNNPSFWDKLGDIFLGFLPKNISEVAAYGMLLDNPQISIPPTPVTRKEQRYLSPTAGFDYVDKLVQDPSSQTVIDTRALPDKEDMLSLSYFANKFNLLQTINITSSTAVGSKLFEIKVGPLFKKVLKTETPTNTMDYYAAASGAQLWSGSLDFHIDAVGTLMHECRLDLVFLPETFTAPTSYDLALTQFTNSIEIRNTSNFHSITCPFISDTPYKSVYNGLEISTSPDIDERDYWTGTFAVYAGSTLIFNDLVANNMDINIFMSMGKDFMFHLPNMTNRSIELRPYPSSTFVDMEQSYIEEKQEVIVRRAKKQSGRTSANQRPHSIQPVVLGSASGTNSIPSLVDDPIPTLRELAKRQSPQHFIPFSSTNQGSTSVIWPREGDSPFEKTALARIMAPFRNAAGGFVFTAKVYRGQLNENTSPHVPDFHGYVAYIPPTNMSYSHNAQNASFAPYPNILPNHYHKTATPLAYFSNKCSAEFSIPHHYMSRFTLIPKQSESLLTNYTLHPRLVFVVNDGDQNSGSNYCVSLTAGFADETFVGTFIGLPQIRTIHNDFPPPISTSHVYPDGWTGLP